MSATVSVRVSVDKKKEWTRAAQAEDKKLSEYVKIAVDEAIWAKANPEVITPVIYTNTSTACTHTLLLGQTTCYFCA